MSKPLPVTVTFPREKSEPRLMTFSGQIQVAVGQHRAAIRHVGSRQGQSSACGKAAAVADVPPGSDSRVSGQGDGPGIAEVGLRSHGQPQRARQPLPGVRNGMRRDAEQIAGGDVPRRGRIECAVGSGQVEIAAGQDGAAVREHARHGDAGVALRAEKSIGIRAETCHVDYKIVAGEEASSALSNSAAVTRASLP
ncbi:MAG: hypothetical protein MZW92_13635 [Comamonadaceae bacterium]|nr:hypothetical protein [Comamonadaceae bacterium]